MNYSMKLINAASASNYPNNLRMTRLGVVVIAFVAMLPISANEAHALPSFARQTGTSCGACHTDFPQLTPFGRRFKLGGYTMGGGENSADYKKTFGGNQWVPPISVMGIFGYSQTATSQPVTDELSPGNNYFAPIEGSVFYGGAITNELGAFVQATYEAGANATEGSKFFLDNTDVRYAKSGSIFGANAIFGITLHNNPTVQDVWNTTPAWGFPFVSSEFAPTPAAATVIEGNFAGKVLGVGAYTFINDMFYLEATAYKGMDRRFQNTLGVWDASPVMDRVSPYVRAAVEPHWGNHWLMVGAFWFSTSANPSYADPVAFPTSGSDKFVDVGIDSQYQYMGKNFVLTLRGSYIHEKQTLDATFANFGSDNPTNTLNSFKAQASYAWNTDAPGNKWIFTGGYFNTWGSTDFLWHPDSVTTGSPNSDGWIAEIAWFPFAMSKPSLWPYFNARVGLQYIWYNKFNGTSTNYDGAGRNASDNNTLFAYVWFAL